MLALDSPERTPYTVSYPHFSFKSNHTALIPRPPVLLIENKLYFIFFSGYKLVFYHHWWKQPVATESIDQYGPDGNVKRGGKMPNDMPSLIFHAGTRNPLDPRRNRNPGIKRLYFLAVKWKLKHALLLKLARKTKKWPLKCQKTFLKHSMLVGFGSKNNVLTNLKS